jgi:serine/threonine protein kinase
VSERPWQRVRELFERALDEDPAERDRWLAREAPDSPDVHREVRSLLDHHGRAGAFLETPAGARLDALMGELPMQPGRSLGPYTVLREIGQGGMGRVYLASDTRLQRHVALKAVAPELARDASQRERLRREARVASGLAHPGICTIYALEEFEGELFIAAEFVEGRTLQEEIRTGPPPDQAQLLRTAHELAAALAYAHARGVVHGDLTPANVMRAADGRIKVLDFGLARMTTDSDGALTQAGMLVGTPAYMSPERLNGRPADAAGDVFAFGVLLSEYATGLHPFAAPTVLATTARILEGEATPADRQRPDVPPAIAAVISSCLRRNAAERFASAAEIVQALETPAPRRTGSVMARWWRTHQGAAIALDAAACGLAWQVKEWRSDDTTTAIFILVGIAATIAAVFRGHLMFTHRVNGGRLGQERRRAAPVTAATALVIGLALVLDGLLLAATRPLPGVVTIGLGIGIVLARLVVEPSTTSATFESAGP